MYSIGLKKCSSGYSIRLRSQRIKGRNTIKLHFLRPTKIQYLYEYDMRAQSWKAVRSSLNTNSKHKSPALYESCNARNTFTRPFLSKVVEFLKLIPYAALLKWPVRYEILHRITVCIIHCHYTVSIVRILGKQGYKLTLFLAFHNLESFFACSLNHFL